MQDFDRLLEIMARLRAPGGCPWDREQDHRSIRKYVIEEAYEVAEAIDRDDPRELCSELGDLLLQVVFHAQMASERGAFDAGDVCRAVCEKMERRHPHVFGDVTLEDDHVRALVATALRRIFRFALAASVVDDDVAATLGQHDGGRAWLDRKSTRLNSSHVQPSRMPSSA